jgi:hypothetical protein
MADKSAEECAALPICPTCDIAYLESEAHNCPQRPSTGRDGVFGSVMTGARNIWAVLTNLIAVAVVLAMFDVASSRFETVVVSGLTLVYVGVTSSFALLGRSQLLLVNGLATEFVEVKRLLRDTRIAEHEEQIREMMRYYRSTNIPFYINICLTVAIWLIAVWHLLNAAF